MTGNRILAALACGLAAASVAAAVDNFPDGGPKLRDFDPKQDCKCVASALKRVKSLRKGYQALAESYKDTLKDLGTGKNTPAWVDPNAMNEQQIKRLIELNKTFDREEQKLAKGAPPSDCGFPAGANIVLETSSLTGALPSAEQQAAAKRQFPFEELFDAVMLHEAHHSAQFNANNPGFDADRAPKTRTPYGRALEEAQGYAVEIEQLEKLLKQCKFSFKDVKLNMRAGTPPDELLITNIISGEVCGDPHGANWMITVRTVQSAGGMVIADMTDPPWDTDCVEPGGEFANHYENVIKNSPQNATSWYCMFAYGPPQEVTIRTPKLTVGLPGMEMKIDPPQSRVVEAEVGACEEERAPDKKDAPVPVS